MKKQTLDKIYRACKNTNELTFELEGTSLDDEENELYGLLYDLICSSEFKNLVTWIDSFYKKNRWDGNGKHVSLSKKIARR